MAEAYSAKNPYLSIISENLLLNGPGAKKETRHFVFDLPDSGMQYKAGDALGVIAENPPQTVQELLDKTGWDGEVIIDGPTGEASLHDILKSQVEIHRVNRKFIHSLQDRVQADNGIVKARITGRVRSPCGDGDSITWSWSGESDDWPEDYSPGNPGDDPASKVTILCEDAAALEDYMWSRDFLDVMDDFGVLHTPEEFVGLADKLKPRLYSIASSPDAHPGKVELTVAIVRYEHHGRARGGLCTVFLADEVEVNNTPIKVFMSPTRSFVLPKDGNTDIIMVGPGTGIAPFRAFIEQRAVDGSTGRNWLFFGDQSQKTEYYYSDQIESWIEDGTLHRYTTAWSRDQAEKIYVQHRMAEHAEELWQWIDSGAYFYVCGDKNYMAKDVHATLIKIAEEQGGMSPDEAAHFVEKRMMREEKRYLRDVY